MNIKKAKKISFQFQPVLVASIFIVLGFFPSLHGEEGMVPLSELAKLDLPALGFELSPTDLYNPGGLSLINSIVKLKGCSGCFVSPDGLIITNYHCAFSSIQSVTTKEKDYMKEGFMVNDRAGEIPLPGVTARLIESYRDVSTEVLGVVNDTMNDKERALAIEKKCKQITIQAEKELPGYRAEVAEMFIGKTYILFIYAYLEDVRLVFAPPRSVGEFGGEEDNWMWPRHTGDFAFFRAYVAPDGSYKKYAANNVPFHPKKYLEIAYPGINEGDFVFILGYPGRTFRHRTSHYIAFQENVEMPYMIQLYRWYMDILEEFDKKSDRTVQIKLAATYKRLSNSWKRNYGQLKGMKNLALAERRKKEETTIQKYIDLDPGRFKQYGTILSQIHSIYQEQQNNARFSLTLHYLLRSSILLQNAHKIYVAANEKQKKDEERESEFMDRNIDQTFQQMKIDLHNFHQPTDTIFLKEMLMRASSLPEKERIPAIDQVLEKYNAATIGNEKAIDAFLFNAYGTTQLSDENYLDALIKKNPQELNQITDPFLCLAANLYPSYRKMEDNQKRYKGVLEKLLSHWIDIKKNYLGKEFIPDANSTLRLSYGRVRGYSPADAIYHRPFTTLGGVIAKHTGQEPFNAPTKQIDLYRTRDFGSFVHPDLKEIPVAMLYNTDTTGGNSGSPVLNARGKLVGLNFDRVFEATINDFAWDEKYSRSIGVDIRYVLWFLEKYSQAQHLLNEMHLNHLPNTNIN